VKAGFADVRATDAAEVIKPGRDGAMRRFTVFLMTGAMQPPLCAGDHAAGR
jgi:hypothetical protein